MALSCAHAAPCLINTSHCEPSVLQAGLPQEGLDDFDNHDPQLFVGKPPGKFQIRETSGRLGKEVAATWGWAWGDGHGEHTNTHTQLCDTLLSWPSFCELWCDRPTQRFIPKTQMTDAHPPFLPLLSVWRPPHLHFSKDSLQSSGWRNPH